MTSNPLLKQAWTLYRSGRYTTALEMLESKVFQFRDNADFFRILGLCCLRLEDWKGGETYLQRSQQLESAESPETIAGLMVVTAQKKDWSGAVQLALKLQDGKGTKKVSASALRQLRKSIASDGLEDRIPKKILGQWLPRVRRFALPSKQVLIRAALLLIVLGLVGTGSMMGYQFLRSLHPAASVRALPQAWQQPLNTKDFDLPGTGILTLTPDEAMASWKAAQTAFLAYHDSQARKEINRLLLSNAPNPIKERARALIPYLHKPDFNHTEDSVSLEEVRSHPELCEGCTIRWQGVISNLNLGKDLITFDLLVGYQTGQVVQAIVPVTLNFAALLKNAEIVDVLGQVVLTASGWQIQGSGLHQLGFRTLATH